VAAPDMAALGAELGPDLNQKGVAKSLSAHEARTKYEDTPGRNAGPRPAIVNPWF